MKTQKSTFGVIFYLRKYKAAKSGRVPIYARITVNGRRTDLSVKRSVEPANWNEHKGMAKGSREEITKLNKYLEEYRAGIVDAYQELQLKKKLITAELVKDKFSGEEQSEFTLCKLMDYHNTEEAEVLEQGTVKKLLHYPEVCKGIFCGSVIKPATSIYQSSPISSLQSLSSFCKNGNRRKGSVRWKKTAL